MSEIFSQQAAHRTEDAAAAAEHGGDGKTEHYRFPGNVRELRNLIERAYILTSTAEIGTDDLPLAQSEGMSAGGNGTHSRAFAIPISDSFDLTAFWRERRKN